MLGSVAAARATSKVNCVKAPRRPQYENIVRDGASIIWSSYPPRSAVVCFVPPACPQRAPRCGPHYSKDAVEAGAQVGCRRPSQAPFDFGHVCHQYVRVARPRLPGAELHQLSPAAGVGKILNDRSNARGHPRADVEGAGFLAEQQPDNQLSSIADENEIAQL